MMTPDQISELQIHIVYINEYYRHQPLSDAVVAMYADDLKDLPFESVQQAYLAYRKNPRNTRAPQPSAIRDLINPEIDDETFAISTAAKVLEAVTKFGYNWNQTPSPAKEFIGEIGWVAVDSFGGWNYICENLGTKTLPKTTFQAQVREIAKAQVKVVKAGGSLPQIEQAVKHQIGSSSDNVFKMLPTVKEVPRV